MKKVLMVFVICALVLAGAYYLKSNNYSISQFTGSIQKMLSEPSFVYSNDFKVNKLQMKVADYYFNKLTDDQKKIYSSLAEGISKFEKKIKIKDYEVKDNDTTFNDVSVVMEAFFSDHPEVFYLSFEYKLSTIKTIFSTVLEVEVGYSENSTDKINEEIETLYTSVQSFTKDINSSNDFDKEVSLHDTLGKMVMYYKYSKIEDIPDIAHSSYGAMINKTAVCDGLTKAMQLLLDNVGVESILVSGTTDGQPHAWNMVKLDNVWYHMDLTSDKLIKNEDGSSPNVIHSYFNITESQIVKTHTIDRKFEIPKAEDTKYNYYIITQNYIYGVNNFDMKLEEIVENQKNSPILEFASDNFTNIPDRMSKILYDINFNGYGNAVGTVSINYYNVLNTYIVVKK